MDSTGLLLIYFVVFYYQFSTILGSELIPRQLFESLQLMSGTQFQYVTLRNVPKVGFIYTFFINFIFEFIYLHFSLVSSNLALFAIRMV